MAKQQTQTSAPQAQTHSDFTHLLAQEFRPKSEQAREAVEFAVQTLAEQALQQSATISDDAYKSIAAIISQIDHKLSEQINLILHQDEYQKLESAWRGLHHLVSNTETDEHLNDPLHGCVERRVAPHDAAIQGAGLGPEPALQADLRRRIRPAGWRALRVPGRRLLLRPYAARRGPARLDREGLRRRSHAVHLGAAPSVLQMESWQELANPRDLTKIFTQNLEYASWNSLRNTDDARYVGLAMPRFLSRLPYGAKTNPVDEFDFEEDTQGSDHRRYAWANAAYAMGVNVNRSSSCTAGVR